VSDGPTDGHGGGSCDVKGGMVSATH